MSIKSKLVTLFKNKLVSNFIYLYGLQAFNFILPLFTFPYLINTLQPELFGVTLYSQTIMLYFIIIIEYSYNITAIRKISINRNNKKKIEIIFNRTITTKIYLLLISITVLTIIILLIPKFSNYWLLYLFSSGLLIGQVIFPTWLFQGLQEMKYLMYLNVLSKTIFTILIFMIVKVKSDYLFVNLIYSISAIITGLISFRYISKKYNLKLKIVQLNQVKNELKFGFLIFISNFSNQIYVISNIIILGLTSTELDVGNYSIAEKIMLIIRQLLMVFSQVIYPHICELSKKNEEMKRFFIKSLVPLTVFISLLCIFINVFSDDIVYILINRFESSISTLIKLLSVVPIIVTLNISSYQTLLAYNQKKTFSTIIIYGAIINIILNLILSNILGAIGTIISIITTELFITIALYVAVKKFYKSTLTIQ
jgi:PST family polysaccharide transporter